MTTLIFDWSDWDGVAEGRVTLARVSWRRDPETLQVPWSRHVWVPGRATEDVPEMSGEVLRIRWTPEGASQREEHVLVPTGPNPDREDGAWYAHLLERVDSATLEPLDGDDAVTAAEVLSKAAEAAERAVSASAGISEAAERASSSSDTAAGAASAASVSAESAETAAEDARTHATTAGTAADVAERAAREAGGSAEAASSSADEAESAAASAQGSEESAATASESAESSASAAESSAIRAERSASDAAESAAGAARSASSAVSAADALNADAREFGDRVRSGTFKGDAGPANVLSIGTVSTLPPGSKATAAIVGASPSQVLNLGLVEGPEGKASTVPGPPGAVPSASDYLLVGPGRPDQPATTNGVVKSPDVAPVGARYESVDGAGVGARTWRKVAGGAWVVTDGDTGWRTVGTIENGGTVAIAVRRTPERVEWRFTFTGTFNAGAKFVNLGTIPGFGPSARTHDNLVFGSVLAANIGNVVVNDVGRVGVLCHSSGAFLPSINLPNTMSRATVGLVGYPAGDPWPTAPLPGT